MQSQKSHDSQDLASEDGGEEDCRGEAESHQVHQGSGKPAAALLHAAVPKHLRMSTALQGIGSCVVACMAERQSLGDRQQGLGGIYIASTVFGM